MTLYPNGHQSMITPLHPHIVELGPGRPARAHSSLRWRDQLFFTTNPAHGIFPHVISPLDARGYPFLVFWPVAIDQTRLDIVWFTADWGDGRCPTPSSGSVASTASTS